MAGGDSISIEGDYSVKANHKSGENGWLYKGNNTEAAKTIHNPNTDPEIVGSGYGALPLTFEENLGRDR